MCPSPWQRDNARPRPFGASEFSLGSHPRRLVNQILLSPVLWGCGDRQTPRPSSFPNGTPALRKECLRQLLPALWGVGGLSVQGAGGEGPGWLQSWASSGRGAGLAGTSSGDHPGSAVNCWVTLDGTLPCCRLSLLSVTRGGWSGDDFQDPLSPTALPSDAVTLGKSPPLSILPVLSVELCCCPPSLPAG